MTTPEITLTSATGRGERTLRLVPAEELAIPPVVCDGEAKALFDFLYENLPSGTLARLALKLAPFIPKDAK